MYASATLSSRRRWASSGVAVSCYTRRIKATWAYTHQPGNAAKYDPAEVRTIKTRIRNVARKRMIQLPDPTEFARLLARLRRRGKRQG